MSIRRRRSRRRGFEIRGLRSENGTRETRVYGLLGDGADGGMREMRDERMRRFEEEKVCGEMCGCGIVAGGKVEMCGRDEM